MQNSENITFSVPRFLSFIDLGYLLEAAKVSDEYFANKISKVSDENVVGNLNATRQSLLRAVFISSYAIIEQNLDELVIMEQKKRKIQLSPNDLKDRGLKRSLTYAKKVLNENINSTQKHWSDIFALQEIRNHLVHYGFNFSESEEHNKRFARFSNSKFVTISPAICFSLEQIENIFELYMRCINDFTKKHDK